MNKLVIIVGPSGIGKSTLANKFTENGYKKIVTYTTRPKRNCECEYVDYKFISEYEFVTMLEKDMFAEYQTYDTSFAGTVYYGSTLESYDISEENKVIVQNPRALMQLLCSIRNLNPIIIYLNTVSEELLIDRLKARGDSEEEIERRMKSDKEDFSELECFFGLKTCDREKKEQLDLSPDTNYKVISMDVYGMSVDALFKECITEINNDSISSSE